jgi:hypothetical protein
VTTQTQQTAAAGTPERPPTSSSRRRGPVLVASVIVVLLVAIGVTVLGSTRPVMTERFDRADSRWVDSEDFWGEEDQGRSRNADWFANDGALEVRGGQAHTDDRQFRMYTWRDDLQDASVSFDLTWHGFSGGDADWRGMAIWLNRTACTPVPECDAVDDPEGNSGYMLRFVAADGSMIVNKKVSGDTREEFPARATDFVQGGTYYWMDKVAWEPEPGRTYRLEGSVSEGADGSRVIEMRVDGELELRVVDDGSTGGPPLTGGRVGVRGDYADMTIDDLEIRR